MRKRIAALILAVLMIGCLAGCAQPEDTQQDSTDGQEQDTGTQQGNEQEQPDAGESGQDGQDGQDGQGTGEAAGAEDPFMACSEGIDDKGFFEGVEAASVAQLPEYKGITIPDEYLEPDSELVNQQVLAILETYAEYEKITDRAVEDGDTLNIDYVGSVDGVEFEGGSTGGMGTDVTIGVTQYIDDFLEQLIGHMPGENFDIEVTFPDPYQNADLAGKDAVFNITINYIQGENINDELTDEMARREGFNTADELLADIQAWAMERRRTEYTQLLLKDAACSEIPGPVMENMENALLSNYRAYSQMYGMDLDVIVSMVAGFETADELVESQRANLEETARETLCRLAIAEKEGLTVTDEDVTEAGYGEAVATYGQPYVYQYVLTQFIVPQFIYDNAN